MNAQTQTFSRADVSIVEAALLTSPIADEVQAVDLIEGPEGDVIDVEGSDGFSLLGFGFDAGRVHVVDHRGLELLEADTLGELLDGLKGCLQDMAAYSR